VVAVSREFRSLGRALQPVVVVQRPGIISRLVRWFFRHLPALLLILLAVKAWQAIAGRVGPLWTELATLVLCCVLVVWSRSRRWLLAFAGCLVTRARLRTAFAELRLCRRSGRPPLVVAMKPTPVGERVWLVCPVGVSAEDIGDEVDRLRAACFAREVRVARDRRWSALVVVDVIRRDTLAPSVRVGSPMAERSRAHV
jgi:hypothetical protein